MTIVVRPPDYSPTSSFRLYTLKDKKHAMYEDDAAEQKALFKDFSADDKTGGNYNGYNKLYKDLVDQDKGFLPNCSRI